jgi:hypothetical protein
MTTGRSLTGTVEDGDGDGDWDAEGERSCRELTVLLVQPAEESTTRKTTDLKKDLATGIFIYRLYRLQAEF